MSGGPPKYPGMSDEERALVNEQTDTVRQLRTSLDRQYQQQDRLLPVLLQRAGIESKTDEQGNVSYSFSAESTEDQARFRQYLSNQDQLEQQIFARQMAAYRGEISPDVGLIRNLDDTEQKLHTRLQRQMGPGYETSSAGIRTLQDFEQRKAEILDAARRGDIEQLSGQRSSASAATGSPAASLAGYGGMTELLAPNSQGSGAASQMYGNILGTYGQERANDFNSSMQRYQQRGAIYGALIGSLLGAVGGTFGGAQGAASGQQSGQAIGMAFA